MQEFWHTFLKHRSKDGLIDGLLILLVGFLLGWIGRGFGWVGKQTAAGYRKQMEILAAITPEQMNAAAYEYRNRTRNQVLQGFTLFIVIFLVIVCYAFMNVVKALSAHLFGWFAILILCIPVAVAFYNPFSTGRPYLQWHFFRTILIMFVIAAIPVSIKLYLLH